MNDYSIPMALADYIPVLLFAVAAVILQRDLYQRMSKGAFALFAAGTIDVFCAGLLKATYKLLYAASICDFAPLSQLFFPLQAIGFLLAGIGVIALLTHKQGNMYAVATPVLFSGTFVFVSAMVLGVLGIDAGLAIISIKMKRPLAMVLFLVAFIMSLAMGYLSSKDFTQSYMNWVAECVNILGQGAFLGGTLILHKSGLSAFSPTNSEEV